MQLTELVRCRGADDVRANRKGLSQLKNQDQEVIFERATIPAHHTQPGPTSSDPGYG